MVSTVFLPSLIERSHRLTTSGPISQARTQVMWAPSSSHSGSSNTTRVESVQAATMCEPGAPPDAHVLEQPVVENRQRLAVAHTENHNQPAVGTGPGAIFLLGLSVG